MNYRTDSHSDLSSFAFIEEVRYLALISTIVSLVRQIGRFVRWLFPRAKRCIILMKRFLASRKRRDSTVDRRDSAGRPLSETAPACRR